MRLYFFRHALAVEADPSGEDARRELTKEGIARTKAAAKALAALGLKPTRLYSSPYIRARQTADLLAHALKVEVQERPGVGPGFSVPIIEGLIADLQEDDEVLFVGHEPDFSTVVSGLIGGGQIVMKKGGLARVDIDTTSLRPLRGTLVWLFAPKLLNHLK